MIVGAEPLKLWVRNVFIGAGVVPDGAAITAEFLVRSNLRGIDTHGVSRLGEYLERMRRGDVRADAWPSIRRRSGVLHVDGRLALGQVVVDVALDEAIAGASSQPFVPCLIHRSGHMGALSPYVLKAAEAGMIALMCQETRPVLWPEGAIRPAIGNNPLAFAAPVAGRPPLVFDMATSAVSHARFRTALREGLPLPAGWANGPDGCPTTDPARAASGGLAPVAGHKGIGLAMVVQCLAAALTGASERVDRPGEGGSSAGNVGAFLLIANPRLLVGAGVFEARMNAWLSDYLAAFATDGIYPGLGAASREAERLAGGIPLSESTAAALRALQEQFGVPLEESRD